MPFLDAKSIIHIANPIGPYPSTTVVASSVVVVHGLDCTYNSSIEITILDVVVKHTDLCCLLSYRQSQRSLRPSSCAITKFVLLASFQHTLVLLQRFIKNLCQHGLLLFFGRTNTQLFAMDLCQPFLHHQSIVLLHLFRTILGKQR